MLDSNKDAYMLLIGYFLATENKIRLIEISVLQIFNKMLNNNNSTPLCLPNAIADQ